MLQLWHFMIAITWLCHGGVHTYSTNDCRHSDMNGLRTWGPDCQFMCHCNKEEACDSSGYCANGCTHGWVRLTSNGSCSVEIPNNSTPNSTLQSASHYSNSTTLTDEDVFHFEISAALYYFSQDNKCTKDRKGVITKYARLSANPPVVMQKFIVVFKVKPHRNDIAKATFSVRNFQKQPVTRVLKFTPPDSPNMLSDRQLRSLLVDSITVAVTSMPPAANCSPALIDGFIISGKPICPYGKWGLRCERNCECPCTTPECHPTSGRCLDEGLICPAKTFGQGCSKTCSSGCFGYPRECHVLTGECKACELRNMSGVSCRLALTSQQLALRDGACKRTDQGHAPASLHNESKIGEFDEYQVSKLEPNKYRVAIIILVFLILFFCSCCCYVQTVQHCAKRRMKERLVTLEERRRKRSSMATYTEFNKEFLEMQEDGCMSFIRKSRKATTTPQSQGSSNVDTV
ncbi:hypothetical protein BsWGS_21331 [Bradybaena similaris]